MIIASPKDQNYLVYRVKTQAPMAEKFGGGLAQFEHLVDGKEAAVLKHQH